MRFLKWWFSNHLMHNFAVCGMSQLRPPWNSPVKITYWGHSVHNCQLAKNGYVPHNHSLALFTFFSVFFSQLTGQLALCVAFFIHFDAHATTSHTQCSYQYIECWEYCYSYYYYSYYSYDYYSYYSFTFLPHPISQVAMGPLYTGYTPPTIWA